MFMVQSQAVEVTLCLSMMIYGIGLSRHHHQACLDLLIIMLISFMDNFDSQYCFQGPLMNIITCENKNYKKIIVKYEYLMIIIKHRSIPIRYNKWEMPN